jgi:hypothetical protein
MTPTTNDPLTSRPTPISGTSSGTTSSGDNGLTDAARDEAGHLKNSTVSASQQVVDTAKEKAQDVTAELREQTSRLTAEARQQLSSQATNQRDRAAQWLRSMGDELSEMAHQAGQDGPAAQLARQGSTLSRQAADFLEQRRPEQLLDEVRNLARRRPGTFLLGAALAGVVAGRLTRSLASNRSGTDTSVREGYGESRIGSVESVPVSSPTPTPTPTVPDPDPGTPVSPTFGPQSGERWT